MQLSENQLKILHLYGSRQEANMILAALLEDSTGERLDDFWPYLYERLPDYQHRHRRSFAAQTWWPLALRGIENPHKWHLATITNSTYLNYSSGNLLLSSLSKTFFSYFPRLKQLRIHHCIGTLPIDVFESCTGLESLWLAYYNAPLPLALLRPLSNLVDLRVQNTWSATFNPELLSVVPKLRKLELQRNKLSLSRDFFKPVKDLEYLNLKYNDLKPLPLDVFTDLHKLEYLHLGGCHLYPLEGAWFAPLQRLKYLQLSHTAMLSGDLSALVGLPIEHLLLNHCQLSRLDLDSLHQLTSLRSLSLYGNRALRASAIAEAKEALPYCRILH